MVRNALALKGRFIVEHYRDGVLLNKFEFPNGSTNGGKDKCLDILFYTDTKISDWYIGLISSSGYSALAAADTMSSHAGWTEFTDYDESTRVEWSPDAASSQETTNSTPLTFTMNASGTVKGLFCCSDSTISGTSGILLATALFTSDQTVNSGDELKVTYTVSL